MNEFVEKCVRDRGEIWEEFKVGIFSFLKRERQLKCDWCKKEMTAPSYVKSINGTEYGFCSKSCKKNFRKQHNKGRASSCPACALRR